MESKKDTKQAFSILQSNVVGVVWKFGFKTSYKGTRGGEMDLQWDTVGL